MTPKHFDQTDRLPFRLPASPGQRPAPADAIPAGLLFRGHQEILIAHNGDTYRLRITRNGGLILTK